MKLIFAKKAMEMHHQDLFSLRFVPFAIDCRPGEEAAFIPLETTPLWQIKQQRGRLNPKSIDYELGVHFPDRFHALLPSHHN